MTGGLRPTTSLLHDVGLLRRAGGLVILFQGHHQHGVGIVPELHQVRHTAHGGAVVLGREGGFVDRAVLEDETVIGAIQGLPGLAALLLGPALVLRLQDAAGLIAYPNQRGQALAHHRAVGLQGLLAVGDGQGFAVLHLQERFVFAYEETALGDMALQGREWHGVGRCVRTTGLSAVHALGQPLDRRPQLCVQVALADHAVVARVQPAFQAPRPQHHVRVLQEIAVDGDGGAFDGEGLRLQPGRVGVGWLLAGPTLLEEQNIGDDIGAFAFERLGGQPDRAQEVGLLRDALADGGILLVQGVM